MPFIIPTYTLGSDVSATFVAPVGGAGYWMRRKRWLMACSIAFLLLTAL